MGSRNGAQGWLPRALTQARKAAGISQTDLAKRLKISRQMIVRYETEGGAAPAAEKLRPLAKELGTAPSAFIDPQAQGMAVLRARVGLSQQQVAEQLSTELPLQAYRGVESGRVARLRSIDAQALAEVFGVTAEVVRAAHEHDLARIRQNATAPQSLARDTAATQI
ncbi:helix-turn-helix transcriptional regulator [Nocardiopsis sp. CNS-639]|uniref:helix-turn-helix domain-containing protein n=1 Tax=Nocardiopsis sp. CNS-639 TaxID=1169153 RepID=UPI00037E49BE|nr:helix-turn-helix transcriptional regulator [Nocardiopsis sp. CNS-639]